MLKFGRPVFSLSVVCLALALSIPVLAAQPLQRITLPAHNAPVTQEFGTQDSDFTMMSGDSFRPIDSGTTYTTSTGTGAIHVTAGGGYFQAPINIPRGALLQDITIYVNDADAANDVAAYLVTGGRSSGAGVPAYFGYTATVSTSGTPGNTALVIPVNGVLPAYDGANDIDWQLFIFLVNDNAQIELNSARLRWKRQVSPAPATARFTDVPTSHPFFQYIEALAAAGITGGCAPNQYCPDAPITRGQMAVFLSRALGLHWAP